MKTLTRQNSFYRLALTVLICGMFSINTFGQLSATIGGFHHICTGDSALLIANCSGNTGTLHYSWTPSSGLSCATCDTIIARPAQTTTYTLVASDNIGSVTATVVVQVDTGKPYALISIVTNDVCQNSPVTFTADSFNTLSTPTFQWVRGGINVGGNSTVYRDSNLSVNDDVYLIMTDSAACVPHIQSISNILTINWLPSPGSATLNQGGGCVANNPLTLNIQNGEMSANQVQWQLAGQTIDTVNFPDLVVAGGNGYGSANNQFKHPAGIFIDRQGYLYVADQEGNRILKFPPNSNSSTAGVTVAGGNGFGSAANQLAYPYNMVADDSGNVYVSDFDNDRVQKWAPGASAGITVAGGNGYGSAANQLYHPRGIALDQAGALYIADADNVRIQKWLPGATQGTTVALNSNPNYEYRYPMDISLDRNGNIYIADYTNNRILKWVQGDTVGTTVAGGNGWGAHANQLAGPRGVFVDSIGNVYVSDFGNYRVQRWAPGATIGVTVAGGNGSGQNNNQISDPYGIYVDHAGYIYVAGDNYNRVQKWPATFAPIVYIPTQPGLYTAIVTDGNCSTTSNAVLIQPCLNDTVWPGDANSDGVANLYDVLSLGLAYGDTGAVRPNANNTWTAQYCPAWVDTFNTGVNHNHADCDGNGVVDANDTVPIVLNYGNVHQKGDGHQRTPGAAPLYLAITNAPVNAGDTARFNIYLGDTTIPANNIYGLAFSVLYDSSLVQANSMSQQFVNSWLGTVNTDVLTLHKPLLGQLDLAITRIDHNSRSGGGPIGELSVITIDNISGKDSILFGKMVLEIAGALAVDNNGNPIPLDAKNDTLSIFHHEQVGVNETASNISIKLFPNPASESITLVSSDEINSYVVYTPDGKEVMLKENIYSKQTSITTTQLAQGIYILQSIINGQKITKRFTVIH